MYSQKEINNDRKHYLKEQKENTLNLISETQGTEICWEVSCDYEKFSESVITNHRTEKQAVKNIKSLQKDFDNELFYRPIIIDSDSGEIVTFQNLHYYKKNSYFVKRLNKYLHS
tara:strand:+ start:988 stop:1329 length:342 start_codon:yes stop_codon:yes gene_type:complete